ncbi:MAG TPA: MetS family NSS transporter small subunit [bacterium]|nr:MetS family NSS transporter small subunit [bacterium]
MNRLNLPTALILLVSSVAAGTGEPTTTVGPLRPESVTVTPERAARHAERLELVARLGVEGTDLEDSADTLAAIVADVSEDPGLRAAAADLLGRVTVEAAGGEERPQALACALIEAALDGDPGGWTAGYLAELSRGKGGAERAALVVGLMVDERLAEFHRSLALDGRLALEAREAAVGVIGTIEGDWAYETLAELAGDAGLQDGVRVAAVGALAPFGYDEGRAFLQKLARENLSPRLHEAVEEGLATIDRTQHMTPGAWIMFTVGVIILFGGSALFISIALKRGKKHVFSDESDGEP